MCVGYGVEVSRRAPCAPVTYTLSNDRRLHDILSRQAERGLEGVCRHARAAARRALAAAVTATADVGGSVIVAPERTCP